MLKFYTHLDTKSGEEWIETSLQGKAVLSTPLLNKGTAFSEQERLALKLLGKLPYRIETLDEQVARAKTQFKRYENVLQKYIYLNNLRDKNEVLFYKLLSENLAETLPLIYTPGVSTAVKEFSHEFRQPRGLYFSYPDRERMGEILDNRTHAEIDVIVATDGERILGIGDQGIGGMDIPLAKLVVYSLCGINPYKALPIMLDVGTDNPNLLNNPLYLGWRHPRIKGEAYDEFIKKFVHTVHQKFPKCLLHWEDFAQQNARRILETYRTQHCTFNDDMQGTGVITLAALLSAIQKTQRPFKDHRIVVFGAGTAGVGIADQIYGALLREGISPEVARKQFWLVDRPGLLTEDSSNIMGFQQPYVRASHEAQNDLFAVVKAVKPTILIGCSTVKNAFSEEIVREMAKEVEYPIIFPLSNPTDNCECDPGLLLEWTQHKALVATGSPFENVAQCNNALAFPGIGLGAIASRATQVTDNMLWAAATAIAKYSKHSLLPAITEIQPLSHEVANAVAAQAVADGVATVTPHVAQNIWRPYYRTIKFKAQS